MLDFAFPLVDQCVHADIASPPTAVDVLPSGLSKEYMAFVLRTSTAYLLRLVD